MLTALVTDQVAKGLVRTQSLNERPGPALSSPLLGAVGLVAATVFAGVALALSAWSPIASLGMGLALGGAASNFVDIIRHEAVVDYIHLGVWDRAFNLADAFILVGSLIALGSFVVV